MKLVRMIIVVFMLAALLLMTGSPASAHFTPKKQLTPVVLFPGWGSTRIMVKIHNQTVAPECPRSGSFEYTYFPPPSPDFSQICMDKLLTMVYKFDAKRPGARPQALNQRGVKVVIADYGKTESAPFYEALFAFLETKGYTRNVNIVVAGNDFRLTPDMANFVPNTKALIEQTYRKNHNTPVHLVGHSNGPLFAQYLLTHTTQQWKNKYIQGFTSLAGNMPGQGGLYQFLFNGFNIPSASFPSDPANAASSAAMFESLPATYMSASDPAFFKDHEVVVRVTGGRDYTPQDAMQLFKDAGLTLAPKIAPFYWGIVKFQPPYYPNVDTYAEIGSGLPTIAGIELPDLKVGQVLGDNPAFIFLDGDSNQEYLTNESVQVWASMPCYRFSFTVNPGVDHISLPATPAILQRLFDHAQLRPSVCRKH